MGDPIEFESIRATFSASHRSHPVFLGSVKDNIGHAEAASGSAGVIKALLMMQHGMIPKQANFKSLNRKIPLSEGVSVPTSTIPWTVPKRIALINNYGAAGSNAALLVREYRTGSTRQTDSRSIMYPILFSAKSESSLNAYTDKIKQYLITQDATLGSIAYNISLAHNSDLLRRIGFCANDRESALSALDKASAITAAKSPVVLCFGGQTGNSVSVSKELYDHCDLFKSHLVSLQQHYIHSIL